MLHRENTERITKGSIYLLLICMDCVRRTLRNMLIKLKRQLFLNRLSRITPQITHFIAFFVKFRT